MFLAISLYQNCSPIYVGPSTDFVPPLINPPLQFTKTLPLFVLPGFESNLDTFVRVINPSSSVATAFIMAFNDAGNSFGPLSLNIAANSVAYFNSSKLNQGDASLGWTTGLNIPGQGLVRLSLESDTDIIASAYSRTLDLTTNEGGIHPLNEVKEISRTSTGKYLVPIRFFNPSGALFPSQLRLINLNSSSVNIVIKGVDDAGNSGDQNVEFNLQSGVSKMITAEQLESGDASSFTGRFGDGSGKWQLSIQSDLPIQVMNLTHPSEYLYSVESDPTPKGKSLMLPLFILPGFATNIDTFVKVINPSWNEATVSITAFNDAGTSFGPLYLSIADNSVSYFNSSKLNEGEVSLGWMTGLNIPGQGFVRLSLESSTDIIASIYSRTLDLTTNEGGIHPLNEVKEISRTSTGKYLVPIRFFNPSGALFPSHLRLINPHSRAVSIVIKGVDDQGNPGNLDNITFTLQPGVSKMITAEQLESGDSASFSGLLGDGSGKWRLSIQSDLPIKVMNLLKNSKKWLTID